MQWDKGSLADLQYNAASISFTDKNIDNTKTYTKNNDKCADSFSEK